MLLMRLGCLGQHPSKIGEVKRDRAPNAGKLVIIDEDDPARLHKPAEIEEVDEHTIEAVITVYEGEIETHSPPQQVREQDLGTALDVIDEVAHSSVFEQLESAVSEPGVLVGVDGY